MARREDFNPLHAILWLGLELIRKTFPRATSALGAFLVVVILPVGAGAGVAKAEPHVKAIGKAAGLIYNLANGKALIEIKH